MAMIRPTREQVDATLELCDRVPNMDGDVYVLAAEVRALRVALEDAEKRVEYAWKDGFASAEAGIAENLKDAIEDAIDILEEDGRMHAAKVLREAALKGNDDD